MEAEKFARLAQVLRDSSTDLAGLLPHANPPPLTTPPHAPHRVPMPASSKLLALPKELRTFLKQGRQLSYDPKGCECGRVTLLPLPQLRLEQLPIVVDEIQHVWGDPHPIKGHYRVPAVNLVATCEFYDPHGNLIWVPAERLFGCWDSDHSVMQVFPGASWKQIVQEPVRYLTAQWRMDASTSKFLIPWPKYPWRRGWP